MYDECRLLAACFTAALKQRPGAHDMSTGLVTRATFAAVGDTASILHSLSQEFFQGGEGAPAPENHATLEEDRT